MGLSVDTVIAAARNAFVTPLGLAHDQWLLIHPEDLGDLREKLEVKGLGMVHGVKIKADMDTPKGEVRLTRAYKVRG